MAAEARRAGGSGDGSRQEEGPEAVGTAGMAATSIEPPLLGQEVEVGPAMVYVTEPKPNPRSLGVSDVASEDASPAASPPPCPHCVLLAHDAGGVHSGRHRQLADAFATQGWLAVLPDFSANADDRGVWYESIRGYCVDYFFPWLEEEGVEAIHCVGFGNGA